MNERIRFLAETAGFCFWEDESWKPEGAVIDWASDYSKEFDIFVKLIISECMNDALFVGKFNKNAIEPIHTAHAINQRIMKNFGIKE